MDSESPLFDLLRQFASTMARHFEINDVLYELGDATVTILDATGAGVSVINDDGLLEFVTATGQRVVEIEHVQQSNQEGPCVEAFRSGEPVPVSDIRTLVQWPEYQATAARHGLRSVVGLPLALDDHRIGSLNVYDSEVRQWTDVELSSARVLADVATAYLVNAGELARARKVTGQLQVALDSRVVIEQAKGMLSRDHSVSVDDAFQLLRDYSRSHNVALRDVATAIVTSGLEIAGPVDGRKARGT